MVLYYESGYNTMFPSRHAAAQSGYNLNLGHVGYAHQHAPAQCGPSDFSYASDPGLQQTGWPTIYGSSVPPRNHAAPGFEPNFKFEDAWSSILPSSSVSSPLSVATTPQTYNPLGRSSGSGLPGPCLDSYSTYNNNRVTCNAIIGGNAAMNGASSHHGNPHLHSAAADNGSRQNRGPYEWMKKSPITGDDLSPGQGYKPGKTRTKDKYRVVYSDHQRLELEKEFHYSRYITIRRKAELAQALQLSERQVKIWFQNRRAKERKTNKKKDEIVTKNIGDQHQQVAVASHAQLHTQHHHHL